MPSMLLHSRDAAERGRGGGSEAESARHPEPDRGRDRLAPPHAPAVFRARSTRCSHVLLTESRKQKVSEVKQQITEEEEEVKFPLFRTRCFLTRAQAQRLMAELHALQQVLLLLLLL
jgi:hypothetical protein